MRVAPLRGESTGSFVNRLAHGQGLELEELLERVGFGQASRDPVRVRAYPSTTEMYVNQRGLEYLAVLCGSTASALQEVLPSTAAAHLLQQTETTKAVWKWPWLPREGHLVPLCGTCAAACGVRETAWMISADRWDAPSGHRTVGAPGLEAEAVPMAPLVLMPEAAAVAARLAAFEHAGRRDGQARTRWMEELRGEMDLWGVDFSVGRLALMDWLQRHSTPAGPAPDTACGTAGVPRELRLSPGHERAAQPTEVLAAASCLPWRLGQPACEM
ncbi:TniQ family protein [Streptomyces sp. NBC_01136]|uniref:TniQ family protein n=1 Tax=unclassified Streptomyces TaxID=2593676 RepID=UPI00324A545C|nr:TniQ family protein [Streptomyces sp. NBC_01136]WST81240.1 TniQ family protein [Streptomyces sp. NBC_01136]